MIERIKKGLASFSQVSDYKIIHHSKKSHELFYVFKRLETSRATSLEDYQITVYVDDQEFRGCSTIAIDAAMSDEEIHSRIEKAVYRASFIKDVRYELPAPSNKPQEKMESNMAEHSLAEWIEKVSEAVFAADTAKDCWLAATEIFLYDEDFEVINSKGINEKYHKYSGMIETIPTSTKSKEEFEIYENSEFGNIDLKAITHRVKEVLQVAKDRAQAVALPKGVNCKVILAAHDISGFYGYFANQLDYASVFQKMSTFELGKSCQGEKIEGDKISVSVVPVIKECVRSAPIDQDGIVLSEVKLVEQGVAKQYHGASRWGQYLKIANPTGSCPIVVVAAGSKSVAEMHQEPYLECVLFSGLQVDAFSGYIGGEVRLGYYFDGHQVIPVTGFTISGNLAEVKANMRLSKEIIKQKNCVGPSHIEIKKMGIA